MIGRRSHWQRKHHLLLAVLFVSGAAALVYEISWSRQLGSILGHTSQTASIVLAAYFLGMAIGYAIAAKIASSLQSPLRAYAYAELLAAMFACLIPFAFTALANTELSYATSAFVGAVLLLPPTAALGATLPFVAEHFSRSDTQLSANLTTAYACNTAGAVFGVLTATFLLIRLVGVSGSSVLAALAAGLAAALIWRYCAVDVSAPSTKSRRSASGRGDSSGSSPTLVLTLATVSGGATLGLQVLYTHLFSLILQNSTYTFGTIIAVFLIALAAGSALTRYALGYWKPITIVGWSCALGSAAVVTSPWIFVKLTKLEYYRAGNNLLEHVAALGWLALQIVGPPVLIVGLVLPTLWFAVRDTRDFGRIVGRLTGVNTVAAALGALGMSHVVLPALGLWSAFSLVAAVLMVAACWCFWVRGRRLETLGIGLLLMGFIVQMHQGRATHAVPAGGALVRRWETTYGWVDLIRREFDGVMLLRQNIHYGLGSNLDARWEKRQGHLPILLHPAPKDVCFLGLGTGLSAAASVEHPGIESILAAELIPEVVEASKLYPETTTFHDDHRVSVVAEDATHVLKRSRARFDVVVGDLFTPFHSHTGYLYTVEHFQHVKHSLRPDGIFCQWLAMWQVGSPEFELIADSFADVFPHTTLWWGRLEHGQSMLALVGTHERLSFDRLALEQRADALQRNAQHPDPFLASPLRIRHLYAGRWISTGAGRLNTNEHPFVEFSAPQSYSASQQLRQDRLAQYWDATMAQLPVDEVFAGTPQQWPREEAFKQWQRQTLTRRVKRGRGTIEPPRFLDEPR